MAMPGTLFTRILANETEEVGSFHGSANSETDIPPSSTSSSSSSSASSLNLEATDPPPPDIPVTPMPNTPAPTPAPTVTTKTTPHSSSIAILLIFAFFSVLAIIRCVVYIRARRKKTIREPSDDLGIPTTSVELLPNARQSFKPTHFLHSTINMGASPISTHSTSHDGAYQLYGESPKQNRVLLAPTTPIIPLPRNSSTSSPISERESFLSQASTLGGLHDSLCEDRYHLGDGMNISKQPNTPEILGTIIDISRKRTVSVVNEDEESQPPLSSSQPPSSPSPIIRRHKTLTISRMRPPPPPPPVDMENDVIEIPGASPPTSSTFLPMHVEHIMMEPMAHSSSLGRGSLIELNNVDASTYEEKQIGI